ncbi:MAG TPA: FeoB-associated Cys-rich membrane protein [Firmicutes bacterium]|nr:FeoB-associated Cys-rich membrane protein [Bacillota bacterium]
MEYLSTIIIAILVGLCFFGAFMKLRRDKKQGKGCPNQCSHCAHCAPEHGTCHHHANHPKRKHE